MKRALYPPLSPLTFVRMSLACLLVSAGCASQSPTPASPSASANADGSTLKASAPTPQSPVGGARLEQGTPVRLVLTNSTTSYTSAVTLSYRFEVLTAGGSVVESVAVPSGSGTTSHVVVAALNGDQTYQWRARPEYQGTTGPWSSMASFVAPANDGYIRGNELYDPLINGKTVGQISGPVTFIPGVGVRLETQSSFISYQLAQPLWSGEFSALITNIGMATAGLKTKMFSMSQGSDDITTDRRRFTVEKRGTREAGAIAWRVIASDGPIETIGADRRVVNFDPTLTYFWRATWAGSFRLIINEGGVGGRNVYDFDRGLIGIYDPNPHFVYLGSPPVRGGLDAQTVPGIVIRQVWVSGNPRPSYANK
jgi:hypothetical protein